MNNQRGLTINDISQGRVFAICSWASFIASFLIPISFISALVLYPVLKDKFAGHKKIHENLRAAFKLAILNLIVIVICFFLYISLVLIPVAMVIAIIMGIINMIASIRGMRNAYSIEIEGQNFDYIAMK